MANMNKKQEFYMSVKAILDKVQAQKDADELRALLGDVNIDLDSKEFEDKVRSIVMKMSKETISIIGEGFSQAFKALGKSPIDFEDLMQLDNGAMWKGMGERVGAYLVDGLSSQIENAISKIDFSKIAKTPKTNIWVKNKRETHDAAERLKTARGKIGKDRVKYIRSAFDMRVSDDEEKIHAQMDEVRANYAKAKNWDTQYVEMLKYVKLHDKLIEQGYKASEIAPLSVIPAKKDASGNIISPERVINAKLIKSIEPQLQASLQNIITYAADPSKQLMGLTEGGLVDVEVNLVPIKTLDTYDILDGKKSIEVPVEPVIKNVSEDDVKPKAIDQMLSKATQDFKEIENGVFKERAFGIKNGKIVHDIVGDSDGVDIPSMKDIDEMWHTHPGSSAFSMDDIASVMALLKRGEQINRFGVFGANGKHSVVSGINADNYKKVSNLALADAVLTSIEGIDPEIMDDLYASLYKRIAEEGGLTFERFVVDESGNVRNIDIPDITDETIGDIYDLADLFDQASSLDQDSNEGKQIREQIAELRSKIVNDYIASSRSNKHAGDHPVTDEKKTASADTTEKTEEIISEAKAHEANAEAIDAEIQAQQNLNDIKKQITNETVTDSFDDDAEIIAQENGTLEEKLELLRDLSEQYGINITQKQRDRYEELNQKDMDTGLTEKEDQRYWELSEQIEQADDALEEFGSTYDKIILKLANGKKVEILPDDKGLRSLYKFSDEYGETYGGVEIDDVIFERVKTEAAAAENAVGEFNESVKESIALQSQEDTQNVNGEQHLTTTPIFANVDTTEERNQLNELNKSVEAVTASVNAKTDAFKNEDTEVNGVLTNEIAKLDELESKINNVKTTLNGLVDNIKSGADDIGAGLNNITINVNYQPKDNAANASETPEVVNGSNEPNEETKAVATIDEEKLAAALGRITFNVKIVEDVDTNNQSAEDSTNIESTPNHDDSNEQESKENPIVAIDEESLRGVLTDVFSSILKPDTKQNGDNAKTSNEEASILQVVNNIQTAVKSIDGKITKGTSGRQKPDMEKDVRKSLMKDLEDRYAELGDLEGRRASGGSIASKERIAELNEYIAGLEKSLNLTEEEMAMLKRKQKEAYDSRVDNTKTTEQDKARLKAEHELADLYGQLGRAEANLEYAQPGSMHELNTKDKIESIKEQIEELKASKADVLQITDELNTEMAKIQQSAHDIRVEDVTKIGVENLLSEYEKLGKLQAQAEADKTDPVKAEAVLQQEQLIAQERERLKLSEDIHAEELAILETKRQSAYNTETQNQQAKAKKQDLKARIKQSKDEARLNKANAAWRKGDDTLMSLWRIGDETIDTSELKEVQDLDQALKDLKNTRKKIADKGGEIVPEDAAELRANTSAVDMYTQKLKELISNYEYFSDENSQSLGAKLTPGVDVKAQLEAAVMQLTNGQAKIVEYDAATQQLTYSTRNANNEVTTFTAGVRGVDGALRTVQGTTKKMPSLLDDIVRKTKEIFTYFSGSSIIYKAFNEIRRGIQYIREIDSALTELKKVTDETTETYEKFLDTAEKTADRVGSTIQEVVSSTADWARLNI